MPMTINIHDAEVSFRDVVSMVARSQSPYTVMDGDCPVVQIFPVQSRRTIVSDPRLRGSISHDDLFSDDSSDWEAVVL